MEPKLITVVVPIYNVEKYLDRCMNSIVNQTYRNLEIILVDDGSPDHCPAMCEAWAGKDSRINVIHKENAGLGMARNTGIEKATGSYICFFDSDDYVAPDTIEKAYRLADAQQADIVVFGMSSVDKHGDIIRELIPFPEKDCFQGEEVQRVFLPDLIDNRHDDVRNKNLCLSTCSCMFSMDLIRKTNWRFISERQNISEDSFSLIWLYRYVGKVAVLREALYFYCENEASLTRTYRADRYGKIRQFYFDCIAMAVEQGYCSEVLERIAGLYLSFTIAALKQVAEADLPFKIRKQYVKEIIDDDVLQQRLKKNKNNADNILRRVFFFTMRNKLYYLCFALLMAQNKSTKR